uniref:Uncharacterized protein n=1 Tax=Meloidogyne enterolobii TaxID=390850 RepID=A0A6V7VX11_MELEN|nr:unnamed protein product [Meloidogyne enterolobii]
MIKIAVFLTFIFCIIKINSASENGKSVAVDDFSTLIRAKRSWPSDVPGLEDCFGKYAYDDCKHRMECCEKHHSTSCTC